MTILDEQLQSDEPYPFAEPDWGGEPQEFGLTEVQQHWAQRRSCADYRMMASLGAPKWYVDYEIMEIYNPVLAAYACREMARMLERHRPKHEAVIAAAEALEAGLGR